MKIEIEIEASEDEVRAYLIALLNKDGAFYEELRDKVEALLPSELKHEAECNLSDVVESELLD